MIPSTEEELTPEQERLANMAIEACYKSVWNHCQRLADLYGNDNMIHGVAIFMGAECAAQAHPEEALKFFCELAESYRRQTAGKLVQSDIVVRG